VAKSRPKKRTGLVSLADVIRVLGRPDETGPGYLLYSGKLKAVESSDGLTVLSSPDSEGQLYLSGLLASDLFSRDERRKLLGLVAAPHSEKRVGRLVVRSGPAARPKGWRELVLTAS